MSTEQPSNETTGADEASSAPANFSPRILGTVLVFSLLPLFLAVVLTGNGLPDTIITLTHAIVMLGGMVCLMAGIGRIGTEKRCAKCEYQQPPQGDVPERCPECGLEWKSDSGTVQGRINRRPVLNLIGVACIVTSGMGLFIGRDTSQKVLVAAMTNTMLIDDADRPFGVGEIWNELNTRTLTQSESDDLAARLIKGVRDHGRLSPQADNWLARSLATRQVPQPLEAEYARILAERRRNDEWVKPAERAWLISLLTRRDPDDLAGFHAETLIQIRKESRIHGVEESWLFEHATTDPELTELLADDLLTNCRQSQYISRQEREWLLARVASDPDGALPERLAKTLIDKRSKGKNLSLWESNWIYDCITEGRLDQELKNRFYDDTAELTLVVPQRARVGETLKVRMDSVIRWHLGMNSASIIYFSGFYLDGVLQEDSRRDRASYTSILNNEVISMAYQPQEVGSLQVRAVFWEVVSPWPRTLSIHWQEDGNPTLPENRLWSKRVELEKIVEVTNKMP